MMSCPNDELEMELAGHGMNRCYCHMAIETTGAQLAPLRSVFPGTLAPGFGDGSWVTHELLSEKDGRIASPAMNCWSI